MKSRKDSNGGSGEERPIGDRKEPSSVKNGPVSPDRLDRAQAPHLGYYRWLHLSRLALAALIMLSAVTLLWLLPWLPSGLDTTDYTPELSFTVYLLGGLLILNALTLLLREVVRRKRERLLAWSAVYDETSGLHNRTYLYDRLSLECERAERNRSTFSVIVLQFRIGTSAAVPPAGLSSETLQEVAGVIDHLIHPTDLVAHLSNKEVAILAIGVGQEHRQPLLERLQNAVAAELTRGLDGAATIDVRGGIATYGVDGNDTEALIKVARAAVVLGMPRRGEAA